MLKIKGKTMSKKQKLIDRLKSRPRNFTYDEAESLLLSLGFTKSNVGRTSGSRVKFHFGNTHIRLHKPHPQKELKKYCIDNMLKKLENGGFI